MPQFEMIRTAIIERICEAKPRARRRLINQLVGPKPKRKKRKKTTEKIKRLDYNRNGKWSEELIAEVLRGVLADHGKITVPLLTKLRKENPDKYPAPTTVRHRFGSWEEAKKAAGACQLHEKAFGLTPEDDVGYFLTLYCQFGVTTRDLYYESRKRFPQIVPPYGCLIDTFGSFTKYKQTATLASCSDQIDRLIALVEDLNGRWPRRRDCKEQNIDILFLDKRLGGRKELKEFIRDLRGARKHKELEIEKQKRDSGNGKKTS